MTMAHELSEILLLVEYKNKRKTIERAAVTNAPPLKKGLDKLTLNLRFMAINIKAVVHVAKLSISQTKYKFPAKSTDTNLSIPTPGKASILSIALSSARSRLALKSLSSGLISRALS
jgi:hypothetical protein